MIHNWVNIVSRFLSLRCRASSVNRYRVKFDDLSKLEWNTSFQSVPVEIISESGQFDRSTSVIVIPKAYVKGGLENVVKVKQESANTSIVLP